MLNLVLHSKGINHQCDKGWTTSMPCCVHLYCEKLTEFSCTKFSGIASLCFSCVKCINSSVKGFEVTDLSCRGWCGASEKEIWWFLAFFHSVWGSYCFWQCKLISLIPAYYHEHFLDLSLCTYEDWSFYWSQCFYLCSLEPFLQASSYCKGWKKNWPGLRRIYVTQKGMLKMG